MPTVATVGVSITVVPPTPVLIDAVFTGALIVYVPVPSRVKIFKSYALPIAPLNVTLPAPTLRVKLWPYWVIPSSVLLNVTA